MNAFHASSCSAAGWVADHDIDTGASLTVMNPRGVTIDGARAGFTCLGCAAEHSALWQYNISGAANVTFFFAQTESPYWQVRLRYFVYV